MVSPGDFLRAVWPDDGFYCIAWRFKVPDGPGTAWAHKVFPSISEAVTCVLTNRATRDIYFAVHTLNQPVVTDESKLGYDGKPKRSYRTQANMKCAKAFFFDIDVDADDPEKYSTQGDAFQALKDFTVATGLPRPTVVSSGGGWHVYWIIDRSMPSSEWAGYAAQLKQLAKLHDLKIDRSRTTDTASVLRVAGTSNLKDPANPRAVSVAYEGGVSETNTFLQQLSDAIVRAGALPQQPKADGPPAAAGILGGNIEATIYAGPPPLLSDVGNACKQVRELLKTRGKVSEPAWLHGILNTVKYTAQGDKTGRELAHLFSQGYAGYDPQAADDRMDRFTAPSRCETIAEHSPLKEAGCDGCPFKGDLSVPNPLVASRRTAKAAAPVVTIPGVTTTVPIPDPPKPYTRLKAGGISRTGKNNDGDEVNEVIYPYDLYPIRRLVNAESATEQHLWCVDLPREGKKEFLLDADALYDPRKFILAITHQGIYPHKSHIGSLQEYMVAYISELQRLVDADAQSNHLGWAKEATQFILPDKILCQDGAVKPVTLSLGAQRASAQVYKRGTLAEQIRLLRFYKDNSYAPHQAMVLAGLAAAAFHETGHHGVILNASGDAGASKSTALYTASAHWGHPSLYPINGTNSGATTRGRNERISVFANLPIAVDEITHMPIKEAQDLAMGVTQPGHRIRLQQDGVERASVDSHKATIMLCTANSSLHPLLSANNTAGTAGSMRVVEMMFSALQVHKKYEADQYLRDLKENFGHTGEVFVAEMLKKQAEFGNRLRHIMREIDEAANIQSGERFWSAFGASYIATAEFARTVGLLEFDPDFHRRWFIEYQIPHMRSVVHDEYSSPLSIITDYLQEISGNTLVTDESTFVGKHSINTVNKPHGSLLAHYDRHHNVLYLLKKGFKDYCLRIGANPNRVMGDLSAPAEGGPIISSKNARRTLGAGTEYAKGQAWCFVLNMSHPAVSGSIDLTAIGGGAEPATPTLRAV